MSKLFGDNEVERLLEVMKERRAIPEAQERASKAKEKLLRAVEAEVSEEEIEAIMQECSAAADAEMRIVVRSMMNRRWMREMKEKIKEHDPELHAKAESIVDLNSKAAG